MGVTRVTGQYVCVLFDLGMARMYTDENGALRPPRTTCEFRGSQDWASGHAEKGRDQVSLVAHNVQWPKLSFQTRFDDLIGWFFSIVELFDEKIDNDAPFIWDFVFIAYNTKVSGFPIFQFFTIPSFLRRPIVI